VRCGRENDPSFAFCLDCGQPLRAPAPPPARETSGLCPKCAAALQPGFRFCGICGAPVGPPPAPRGRPGSAVSQTTPGAASGAASAPPAQAAPPVQRRLTLIRADGAPGATFPLEEDELLCGRTEGEVRLPDDPSVSPRHARFTRSGGDLRVEDLGSVNGIFLRLRAPRRLRVGEEIRLGSQLLRLEPLARPPAPPEGAVRSWGTPDGGCKLRLSQLLEGGGLGEIFPLREGENVVGRDAGEVTFPGDRYVSARHARLDVAGDEVTLADAGSSNGTFVKLDGAAELSAGDQLLVGAQLLRVD
jgi:pSer/pThr/pTyr-binding forkhead associated (FHA) protein